MTPTPPSRASRYALLLRYALPYKRGWASILALSLLSTLFSLLQPWPLKVLMDHVLGSVPPTPLLQHLPGFGSRKILLAYVVVGGFVAFLGSSLVNAASTLQWIRVGQRMVYDLAADLFANIQRRSLLFHTRHPVGDSVSRITGDCWSINGLANALLLVPVTSLVMLIAMIVVMARINPKLTLLTVAITPFMALASYLFGKPIRASSARKREVDSAIQAHVQQTLTGIPVVQAFGQEDREQQRFRAHTTSAIKVLRRTTILSGLAELTPGLLAVLGTAAVLWIGGRQALRGELSPGELVLFLSYLTMMQTHIGTLLTTYTTLQGTLASSDRVLELLTPTTSSSFSGRPQGGASNTAATPSPSPSPSPGTIHRPTGHLRFENVTFGYDPARPVLKNVSFDARPGTTTAIVGPTGAGKSTIVSLIPRLLDPQQGTITLDGVDTQSLPLASLREQISLVLQEPFLFPLTIGENIAYGRPGATLDEIIAAATAANAHDFISKLPEGYDTPVGERGVTLSGGERQRLSLARAFLKNSPLLVLDEPTSALDARTEASLMDAIQRLMKGRTTIVIAHRLSTIRDADQILVLENGRIAESGTHAELMLRRGLYHEFQSIQFTEAPAAIQTSS